MSKTIQHFHTVILGAGFGGLGMGAQLIRNADKDFVILEKSSEIGGVWLDNNYPGAACDTEAHLYCYSFFPHLRVSRMYADREELLSYMQQLVQEYDLNSHLHFNTEVTQASWSEEDKLWHFETKEGRQYTSTYFIPAWGQLNKPLIPNFNGLEKFRGKSFHSARWEPIDLQGKKVASIGNAASAVQYIPEIVSEVDNLTVFQRSANWIMPRNQIVFTKEQLDEYETHPEIFEESRLKLHEFRESGFSRTQMGTEEQEEGIAIAKKHLQEAVADPILRSKLTPDYEFGCKRILRSDDYYPALVCSNVEVETRPITGFYEDGIVVDNDEKIPFDVVIFGTGFSSQAFNGDLVVRGLNGVDLSKTWSDGPEAYLGMAVPNFPNMFLIYGPNTNLNHNSIITMLEIQQNYIISAMREADGLHAALAVKPSINRIFNDRLQEDMALSAFSANCSSWYKNQDGKVINNWSGTVEQYKSAVAWNMSDYIVL